MPGLIRLSAQMGWKATEWGIGTSVRAYSRLLRAAANGESLSHVMQDAGSELREYIRQMLEIVDPEDERWRSEADGYDRAERAHGGEASRNGDAAEDAETIEALRERGA